MRLVFAGTPEPALPALRSLIDSPRHDVIAVLTRPDAASGRHGRPQPSPVARLALERAVALDARLPEGWNELGGVETEAGNLSEALRCYLKALDLAPDLPYALVNAAQTQDKLGHAADAEQLYRHALSAARVQSAGTGDRVTWEAERPPAPLWRAVMHH